MQASTIVYFTPSFSLLLTQSFIQADAKVLAPTGGFLGMGERGIGGSKCGSTAACALLYRAADGTESVLAANVGDSRVVLVRGGEPVQITVDHVPDDEDERKRIEFYNPNPRLPMVRYVGGTWRVGGLLALSRAFGDAYMKASAQFEGVPSGSDGYSSGFGVVAEPYISIEALQPEDSFLVLASDGLFANEERGGGGGLSNEEVAAMCKKMAGKSCEEIAAALANEAVAAGTTDDVTVLVIKLE
jgi:protein phosphatase 1L